MKINQSFHILINKFENLPDYGNLIPFMLNVVLNVSLLVVHNLPDCKMQMLAASMYLFIQRYHKSQRKEQLFFYQPNVQTLIIPTPFHMPQ